MERIIRSICLFSEKVSSSTLSRLENIASVVSSEGFTIQTKRIVAPVSMQELSDTILDKDIHLSVGTVSLEYLKKSFKEFSQDKRISCNVDLTLVKPTIKNVDFLFEIMHLSPHKTFNFSYVFNNVESSPYFPSARYNQDGFSIALQSPNLYHNLNNVEHWLNRMEVEWGIIGRLYRYDPQFLGIDSSVSPLGEGLGSFINIALQKYKSFDRSILSDFYTNISSQLRNRNPHPIGLCGLMFPCLEDTELSKCYENGEFNLIKNLFLSLHSGLGIDTYPIGLDENREEVLNILNLTRALSIKHNKTLSVRFVSDGKANIGDKTNFQNDFMRDVTVKPLLL